MHTNKYLTSHEAMCKSSLCPIGSPGDITTTASYLINNDAPDYAVVQYSQSQIEVINSIKYSRLEIGYDQSLREIKESFEGMPLQFYTPPSLNINEGIGRRDLKEIVPASKSLPKKVSRGVIAEIENARKELLSKEIVIREVEEVISIRRKKRELIYKEKSIR